MAGQAMQDALLGKGMGWDQYQAATGSGPRQPPAAPAPAKVVKRSPEQRAQELGQVLPGLFGRATDVAGAMAQSLGIPGLDMGPQSRANLEARSANFVGTGAALLGAEELAANQFRAAEAARAMATQLGQPAAPQPAVPQTRTLPMTQAPEGRPDLQPETMQDQRMAALQNLAGLSLRDIQGLQAITPAPAAAPSPEMKAQEDFLQLIKGDFDAVRGNDNASVEEISAARQRLMQYLPLLFGGNPMDVQLAGG